MIGHDFQSDGSSGMGVDVSVACGVIIVCVCVAGAGVSVGVDVCVRVGDARVGETCTGVGDEAQAVIQMQITIRKRFIDLV